MLASSVESATDIPAPATPKANLHWYFAFFILSGFCGLVYEVVWVRLAMAQFGVNTALVSIVLSIFMGGLGVGSWGARFIQRRGHTSPENSLRLYAAAEFFIGLSSVAVPIELRLGRQLLLHAQGFGAWQSSGYYLLAGSLLAIALMPWCICMGATFPLLMAVIRRTAESKSKSSFSYLYVANVLGALAGTLVSAFVLIELLGFRGTLLVAGGLNALIAILALRLSTALRVSATATPDAGAAHLKDRLYGLSRSASLVFLFTTGLVSMGMEVVWIRQLTPYLGTVVYAFAEILAVYLLGTLVGSRDYRRWTLSHTPNDSRFSWTLLAVAAVVPIVTADPLLPFMNSSIDALRVSGIVFFCALAGFLTPLLVDSWSAGDPDQAGTAYAVNIAGCIVGPLISSFLLLPALGERWTLVTFCIPLFAIAGLLVFRKTAGEPAPTGFRPEIKFTIAVLIAAVLVAASHDFETRFKTRRVRRDYSATVIATGTGFQRVLLVNGVGMTLLSPITKYISHLPLALLPSPPRNGLVICFGMGTSFRSMVSWGIPTTVVDLIPSVPAMFDFFHADAAKVENSPKARIVIDDGRRFLDGSTETYDVIVVDPPPPVQAAGSSLLYSREFYDVIKRHLSRNGIFQSWYPEAGIEAATTASIVKALRESFPYVRAYRSYDGKFGIHFLASMEPIEVPSSDILASRMPLSAASDFVEWGPASDAKREFDLVLSQELSLDALAAKAPNIPTLTDDRPVNEYYMLRNWYGLDR
jgi:spermidine synthase